MRTTNNIGKTKVGIKYKNHILLCICGVLAVVSVIMTIDSSATGIEVAGIRSKEEELLNRKRELQDELSPPFSVSQLKEKGGELGFVKPKDTLYLSETAPVAKLP